MSSKEVIAFYGDVSQVVIGNVIDVARKSKAVNLTIGDAHIEFQVLPKTHLQDVTPKVKVCAALDSVPALDVYRALQCRLDMTGMSAFPGGKYIAPVTCAACTKHAADIKQLRVMVAGQWLLLLGMVLLCSWLLVPSAVDAVPKFSADARCFVDGKAYSTGSVIRMSNGSMRECMNDGLDGIPRWSVGAKN